MIRRFGNVFVLDTNTTTYAFALLETGHLEHLYYGDKITIQKESDAIALMEKHSCQVGNAILYTKGEQELSLEDVRLEVSSFGTGDIREPFIQIVHHDGSYTSDFLFVNSVIRNGKKPLETLPCSYEEQNRVEELTIILRDVDYELLLELHYFVFEEHDVISRSSKLINTSNYPITLKRLMSTQLDFETSDFTLTTFHGAWAREMKRFDMPITAGKIVNETVCGCSSNRSNPFIMLSKEETSEDLGACYGLNLIYSGNHYEAVEVSPYGKMRVVTGINPTMFQYRLEPNEIFEAPEAVMTYSSKGYNGMSQNMHRFVRECIVRGAWKNKPRPVLLNSWEACYFDVNESKLVKLAKAGKKVGVELLVMDDGWFGNRKDDTKGLGDWYPNLKKLPNGVEGIAKKVNAVGLDFGLWVEPEMVNTDSDLYKIRPEWVMEIPGKKQKEGRNQRMLDLSNPKVVDFVIRQMQKVFSYGKITYVKWDMNRIFSDYYSKALPPERQQEVGHRYILGLYKLLQSLTQLFPNILFEGCASGGNRFDLGMLCYFPQIWASDNTDAIYRVEGQTGYSYGYPLSVLTAHVSDCPNHQTLRNTPLATRFHVSAFGVLGYECNLCEMSKEDNQEIKAQIELYKKWRNVLQYGTFYRGRSGNVYEWTCVSPDKKKAVGMVLQKLCEANTHFEQYVPKGLDEEINYHFYNRELSFNLKEFGGLINQVSPIHIKQNSLLHHAVAKAIKIHGEKEDYIASGMALMRGGVKLKQGFGGTGYKDDIRFFADFASRMYFMEAVEEDEDE